MSGLEVEFLARKRFHLTSIYEAHYHTLCSGLSLPQCSFLCSISVAQVPPFSFGISPKETKLC